MTRSRHRRRRHGSWQVALVAATAVALLVVAMALADRGGDEPQARTASASAASPSEGPTPSAPSDATPTPGSSVGSEGSAGEMARPTLEAGVSVAAALDAVQLTGSYRPGTTLRLQLADPAGRWSSFPLETAVDESGRFTTYAELGRRGPNRLRMIEPATGAVSNEVTVTIR